MMEIEVVKCLKRNCKLILVLKKKKHSPFIVIARHKKNWSRLNNVDTKTLYAATMKETLLHSSPTLNVKHILLRIFFFFSIFKWHFIIQDLLLIGWPLKPEVMQSFARPGASLVANAILIVLLLLLENYLIN